MKDIEPITPKLNKGKHFIQRLIESGEGKHLDFKFKISDAKKIARSLAAFANTEGGTLLVGVKDNGVIAGVRSDEEIYMIQAAAEMYCKPKLPVTIQSWNINGKIVLEVKVAKSKTIPHLAQNENKIWIAWIRVNDQNIIANKVLQEVWNLSKNKTGITLKYSKNEEELLHFLFKNTKISLTSFCKLSYISELEAIQILSSLVVLKIVEIEFSETETYYLLRNNFNLEKYQKDFND